MFSTIFNFIKSKAAKINLLKLLPKAEKFIEKEAIKLNSTTLKEPRWQRWLPFTLIYGGGKIQPVYVWITVFCSLGAWMVYLKNHATSLAIKNGTYTSDMISDALVATVLAFISSLILLYNARKKYTPNNSSSQNTPTEVKNNDITKEGDSQS